MQNRQKKETGVTFFNKIRAYLVFLFAVSPVFFYAQAAAAASQPPEQVLKIGADCTYPPFNYKDSSGAWQGFDVDIANEIARRLHMSADHECVTWDGLIPGLMVGKYDVIIAAMDITPERAKRVDFSIPYYRGAAAFVGLKKLENAPVDSSGRLSPDFLKDKQVGILRSSIYEKYLRKTYPGIKLVRYDTMDAALLDLKADRLDLVFTDKSKTESDFLHRAGNKDFAFIGPDVTDYSVLGEGSAVALRKGDDALREKVNAAIKAMMADGTYDQINHKYWSFSVKP